MADVEGFLELRDEFGACTDIINNCRTLAFLQNSTSNGFRPALDCPDCCCPDIDPCEYTTPNSEDEPAPWYDPVNPGSAEFLGLWGSLRTSQPEPVDGVVGPKTLTFSGVLMSETKRGKTFGMEWLSSTLTPFCVSCSGREATIYTYCPSGGCDEPEIPEEPEPEEPPTPFSIADIFDADGCEIDGADDPLDVGPELEPLVDTGERDLLRVQYVAGSLQELEADFPDCYGCRVTFQFELLSGETFLAGEPICEISPEDLDDLDVPSRGICLGDQITGLQDCDACGVKCACTGTIEDSIENSPTANTMPDGAAECRYSAPLQCKTYACLIDASPFAQSAPVVSIYAGSQDMENVSVSFMEATTGLPNPMTSLGAEVYANREPESTALITRIPAGTTLTLDARSNTSTLNCPGFAPKSGAPLVSGCDNRKYRAPRLCCGLRYWLIIEVDAYTTTHDDWRVTGSTHGAERA